MDIRASSDRYLRNAIIAVLAYDRTSTLWDAARLLSVGEEGYSYRRSVGARVRALPEFKEISEFFTQELAAQLADARSSTTAKLDAPVNKLARLLNSPSIKRVLLNDSLRVDFDQVISGEEVVVVKGALGAMGGGNTSVLMQLLVGMLDASLARQQDMRSAEDRVAVALKVDEAPLVLNRGFTETMALKRSAGLETVACWQTDAQWVDREVRDQLDALFAHRVYFATASARDARAAVGLTMAEFSDTVRPGIENLSALGRPDVRLHLPKHHAIASWVTPAGRQSPFIAQTIPLQVDRERLALHAARQHERGGAHLTDLRQPHWDRPRDGADSIPPIQVSSQDIGSHVRASVRADQPEASEVPELPRDPRVSESGSRAGPEAPAEADPPESYRELLVLDGAASVRWAKPIQTARALDPDATDLEILELIARMRHLLTSQIHRRFNPTRAATTTQRRLKRLADAGLLRRCQFHRHDGGGVPMCCAVTTDGQQFLRDRGLLAAVATDTADAGAAPNALVVKGTQRVKALKQARADVHAAGWVLALERAAAPRCVNIRGPDQSVISPPMLSGSDGRRRVAVADLRLPGGRTPHDFLHTDGSGRTAEADRFDTLRPAAIVEVAQRTVGQVSAPARSVGDGVDRGAGQWHDASSSRATLDILVELDDRLPQGGRPSNKLERYDHFLSGWSVHTRRYGIRREAVPVIVFLCRDRARARALTRAADTVLRACRAYAGEYPFDWEYPGRWNMLFAAERDVHEGALDAYAVPRLPPDVRIAAAHGDPVAAEPQLEMRRILRP